MIVDGEDDGAEDVDRDGEEEKDEDRSAVTVVVNHRVSVVGRGGGGDMEGEGGSIVLTVMVGSPLVTVFTRPPPSSLV